jgi:hypothetical protein
MHGSKKTAAATLVAMLLLGGCAVEPTAPVAERTDDRTAITVATLAKPLLFTGARSATGAPLDLAVGPFELNRQGRKSWYVWVSLLGEDLAVGEPHLRLVSGTQAVVEFAPAPASFMPPLSRAPYDKPAGWATERYYEVSADDLARLYGRGPLDAELVRSDGVSWRFEPWDAAFDRLDAYLGEQLQGRVAMR